MQLLKHFKELTIHPKNAEELKGLILQLAIQGKLTQKWREQNPDVEPASILLEKIQAEKEQLINDKKIKKEKPLPEIEEDEIPFVLPESWSWCRLQNLVSILGDGIHGTPKYTDNGPVYFVNGNNLSDGLIVIKSNTKAVSIDEGLKHKRELNDRTVLVSINGTIGNTAFYNNENIILGKSACYFNLLNDIQKEYIRKLIKSYCFLDYAFDSATGTTIKNVSLRTMREFPIPLPPLEEQRAIVSIVNHLFTEVEELEAQTKQRVQLKEDFVQSALKRLVEANTVNGEWSFLQQHFKTFFNTKEAVKKLRETILQLAVQGKLTHHWRGENPNTEPASVLLKKIKSEKEQLIKDKKIKKEKPLPPIAEEEIPYELPDGWVWCRLGETLLYSDAGKSPNCEKRPVADNEWGVLTTTSIQQNWFDETANKVLPDKFEINEQQIVEVGDILITRAGPINRTGVACKVDKLSFNLILSDKTIRLKYIPKSIFPDCIVQFLNSIQVRTLLLEKMIGMASSQVNISQANIKGIPFPLPPLEEQKAIVAKVNSLMALCDQLEQQIEQNTQQVEDLMKSCLREVITY